MSEQQVPNQLNIEISEEMGTPKSRVKSRIILTPQHAKRLLHALQENVEKFEVAHGTIKDFEEVQIPFQYGGPVAQA